MPSTPFTSDVGESGRGTAALGGALCALLVVDWALSALVWTLLLDAPSHTLAFGVFVAVVGVLGGWFGSGLDSRVEAATYLAAVGCVSLALLGLVWGLVVVVVASFASVSVATTVARAATILVGIGLVAFVGAIVAGTGRDTDWPLVFRMVASTVVLAACFLLLFLVFWPVGLVVSLVVGFVLGPDAFQFVALCGATLGLYLLYSAVTVEVGHAATVEQRLDARAVSPDDEPELHASVTRLASQFGVPKPTVAVSDAGAPGALVVGLRPGETHLVVPERTLDTLEGAELDAIVAHELAHVANRDGMVMTALSAPQLVAHQWVDVHADVSDHPEETPYFYGSAVWIDREVDENPAPVRAVVLGGARLANAFWGVLYRVALCIWVACLFCVSILSRSRETIADRAAVAATGSPASLASALGKLDDGLRQTPDEDLRAASGLAALSVLAPLADDRAGSAETAADDRAENAETAADDRAGNAETAADADGHDRGAGSILLALLWDPHVPPERRSRYLQRVENSLFRTHPPVEQRLDSLRSLYE